jgi:hypothetical protein
VRIFLLEGPYEGRRKRKYVICEINGKRKKINYARYLLFKSGKDIKKYEQVHHKDGNRDNDTEENLEALREYIHKQEDEKTRRKSEKEVCRNSIY